MQLFVQHGLAGQLSALKFWLPRFKAAYSHELLWNQVVHDLGP
jgi:hypothetical protein